jgi:hypothetical protein
MAVGLIQVSDELNDLRCRAENHDPKRKVYFQRDRHRYLLFLIFEDSKQLTLRMEQKFQQKPAATNDLAFRPTVKEP